MGWGGVPTGAGLVREGLAWRGKGPGGGPKAQAQGRSKFRNVCRIFVVSNAYKSVEGCLWGGSGYPPELAWWTGG